MKHYLYLLAVVAGLVLGGCSEDVIGGGGETPNDDGAARLKITFSNGAAATRALGDPFASELAEKTINRLSFYVYPAKEADKDLVPFQRYVFDMSALPLEKDSVTIQHVTGTDATDGYTCNFILREGAGFECIIVAIANAPDNFDETNNLNTYEKLQQAYIDCATMPNTPDADLTASVRADKYGLVMYAEDTRMIKKTLTTDVSFKMERLAARIDISNAAYNEEEAKGFVLQSARIINGKHTSYAIPALTEPWTHPGLTKNFDAITSVDKPAVFQLASATGTLSDGTTPVDITDASLDADKVEQRLWHELYTYENDDKAEATATTIEIKGLFRGAPFSRILPFVNKDKQPVIIERNHRYLVRLNPAPGLTDLTYNITVADWNAVDTINVKPSQKEKPEINFTSDLKPDVNNLFNLDEKAATFALDAVCSFDTQYKVVPEVGDPADTDVSWLTVTQSDPESVTRAATGIKRTYTVATTEMATGTIRRAMLLIANGANFTARDTVHVKQKKIIYYPGTAFEVVTIGKRNDGSAIVWAPVNVGQTAIPTAGVLKLNGTSYDDVKKYCGYYYQWGRKIAFESGRVQDVNTVIPNPFPTYAQGTVDGYQSNKFILAYDDSNGYSWFSDYTNDPVKGITLSSELSGLVWPRKNQPCPTGWHVPTEEELNKLSDKIAGQSTVFVKDGICVISESGENLVLPTGGHIGSYAGSSASISSAFYLWSSSMKESGKVSTLVVTEKYSKVRDEHNTMGCPVRCVQDMP